MRERTHLDQAIERFRVMERELEDAQTLAELADEEGDEASLDESQKMLAVLNARVDKAQIASLLSGEADANDCYVEVNSGAGGTG